jgi:hypothetical protein
VLAASPAYSDESLRIDAAPLVVLGVAVLVAVPGLFLLAFVGIKMLWLVAMFVLTGACVVAPVVTTRQTTLRPGSRCS